MESSKTANDNSSQNIPNIIKNKGLTTDKSTGHLASNRPAKVTNVDSTSPTKVSNSNKQNNKLSQTGDDLAEIVAVWPQLSEAIRSAIIAVVRDSNNKQGG